jgi:hypothetical protein
MVVRFNDRVRRPSSADDATLKEIERLFNRYRRLANEPALRTSPQPSSNVDRPPRAERTDDRAPAA